MSAYPTVIGEWETLDAVRHGASLARYGDGEFSMCFGGPMKSQRHDPTLARRLRAILHDSGSCLVGIPNIHPSVDTPKRASWDRFLEKTPALLSPTRTYWSAFISRPDSAPWIDTPEYWAAVEQVWDGRDVVLVRGSDKGFRPEELTGARSVRVVTGLRQHSWSEYDRLMADVGQHDDLVLLCLGATATVMAVELCAAGMQAVDVGHLALFLRKHRRGEPVMISASDKDRDHGLPQDWNQAVVHA